MDAQTRRTAYEFGDFRVDVAQRLLLLRDGGRPLPLSSRAFDTLLFFLEHPGELLDKSTLMAAIWPKLVVEENNLNQHISALRRVLGERPEEHRFIVTVPGRGYRFVAAVRAATDATSPSPPAQAPVPSASPALACGVPTTPDGAPQQPAAKGLPIRGVFWALGTAGLILGIGVVWSITHLTAKRVSQVDNPSTITSLEVTPVHKPRLAVLPFENLSSDPDNAFFADGLHEEIVSTLAERMPGVEVISRTTMMSYRANPPKPLAAVARELRVSHLMEGSVRREANRIRLTLQLIDARTDGRIWSASYDRTLADSLTLQLQVAEEVAGQLAAQLTRPERPGTAPIRDAEAFDLYLKALLVLRTFNGERDAFRQIEDLLARVITREPGFALAYAQRARARTLMFITSQDTSEAFVSQIRADLATAQRLAPKDPIVLAATGYFLMCANDTSGALEAYALADAAGLAEPEWLIPKAHLLLRRGRIEELNVTIQRMLALDPADSLVIYFAAYHLHHARQPLDALQAAAYGRDGFPTLYAAWRAAILLDFTGRTEELRSFLERYAPTTDPARLADSLRDWFKLLRYEHRYAELKAQIDRVPVTSSTYFVGVDVGPVGQTPTALFRGWTDLLLGDRKEALKDGHRVLRFVERQARTKWNAAYLDALGAAGYVFAGECERARAAGKNSLALVSRTDNAVIWTSTAMQVARVDAWCGEPGEAIELLRELSMGRPGLGPAVITRDPLVTVPLGQLPPFRALSYQLENTMSATRIEPKVVPAR